MSSTILRSDLVKDSRLTTEFLADGVVQHTFYESSRTSGRRLVRRDERWERSRELGRGTFGLVLLQKNPASGRVRALKEIRKDFSETVIDYGRELEAAAKFSHGRYVRCFVESFGWFEDSSKIYLAMEYIEHGDLRHFMSSASFVERDAQDIISQVVEGLEFMHDNHFAHRDLKPANILIVQPGPDWWAKIGDFGISKCAENASTALRTSVGTEGYCAPEVLLGFSAVGDEANEEEEETYTSAVDMWAVGEIVFRMLARKPAFPGRREIYQFVTGVKPCDLQVLTDRGASTECMLFVQRLLVTNPKARLSAHDARAHAWLMAVEADDVTFNELVANQDESQAANRVYEPVLSSQWADDDIEPSAAWTTSTNVRDSADSGLKTSTEKMPLVSSIQEPPRALKIPAVLSGDSLAGNIAYETPGPASDPGTSMQSLIDSSSGNGASEPDLSILGLSPNADSHRPEHQQALLPRESNRFAVHYKDAMIDIQRAPEFKNISEFRDFIGAAISLPRRMEMSMTFTVDSSRIPILKEPEMHSFLFFVACGNTSLELETWEEYTSRGGYSWAKHTQSAVRPVRLRFSRSWTHIRLSLGSTYAELLSKIRSSFNHFVHDFDFIYAKLNSNRSVMAIRSDDDLNTLRRYAHLNFTVHVDPWPLCCEGKTVPLPLGTGLVVDVLRKTTDGPLWSKGAVSFRVKVFLMPSFRELLHFLRLYVTKTPAGRTLLLSYLDPAHHSLAWAGRWRRLASESQFKSATQWSPLRQLTLIMDLVSPKPGDSYAAEHGMLMSLDAPHYVCVRYRGEDCLIPGGIKTMEGLHRALRMDLEAPQIFTYFSKRTSDKLYELQNDFRLKTLKHHPEMYILHVSTNPLEAASEPQRVFAWNGHAVHW